MKKIFKSAMAVAVAVPMLLTTSCIEETLPTDGITASQLASSPKATEALLWEMAAIYNNFGTYSSDFAYDWGYPSIMHIRDVMTEDMAISSSDYDWYSAWEQANYMDSKYASTAFVWNYLYKVVLTTNNVFASVGTGSEGDSDQTLAYIGVASAFRASIYLDLAQMFEFLPNKKTSSINESGNDVLGLTVPIITEKTTEAESKNNPRASREDMAKFILEDLDRAEQYIAKSKRLSLVMPDLAVVYGLKARYYLWLGQNVDGSANPANYQKAAEYARKAISESGATPMTQEQWTDPTTGFNKANKAWLWCVETVKEDRVVSSGLLNWTSWVSNETTFGYAAGGPYLMMYKGTYDQISDTDFRKLSYKAPSSSSLASKVQFIDKNIASNLPTYASVKFRPSGGNTGDYLVACVGQIPLMRVEEMYLIEAEAVAHTSGAEGKALLVDFMTKYRDPNYSFASAASSKVVNEIVLQKRIELWGEGLNFYDMKRLGYSVDRTCAGTNFYKDAQLVSDGRPAWCNLVITRGETQSNAGVNYWNNPSFDGMYKKK